MNSARRVRITRRELARIRTSEAAGEAGLKPFKTGGILMDWGRGVKKRVRRVKI